MMRRDPILTKQRQAVLSVVREAQDHPTAADIMVRLQARGQRFAYGTVYNSLKFLMNAGLIQELQVGDGMSHYDGRMDEHSHIICLRCQAIDEFEWPQREELMVFAHENTNYDVQNVQLVFEGVCPNCKDRLPV